jgi:hypothetical protein
MQTSPLLLKGVRGVYTWRAGLIVPPKGNIIELRRPEATLTSARSALHTFSYGHPRLIIKTPTHSLHQPTLTAPRATAVPTAIHHIFDAASALPPPVKGCGDAVVCAAAAAAGVIVTTMDPDATGKNGLRLAPGANGFIGAPDAGALEAEEPKAPTEGEGAGRARTCCAEAKLAQAIRVRFAKWMTKERLPMKVGSAADRET